MYQNPTIVVVIYNSINVKYEFGDPTFTFTIPAYIPTQSFFL